MNDYSYISLVTIPFLCTALLLFLLFLKELETLQWQEQNWIWGPLSELFIELDLPPYFPEPLFQANRMDLKYINTLKEYRLACFPQGYPNKEGKYVKLIKNSRR